MELETIEIPSNAGVTIRCKHYRTGSKRLLALLPGRHYYVHHTLMHLTTMLGFQLGYDVLLVPYGFQVAQQDLRAEDLADIHSESTQAIEQALAKGYDDAVLVGKSLGTPIAAMLANQFDLVSRVVLLTPIRNSHKIVEGKPTLALIGRADGVYAEDLVVNSETVTWQVYDNLNHAMLVDNDIQASLKVLPDIMQVIEDFLKE